MIEELVQEMMEDCKDLASAGVPYLFWICDANGYASLQCNVLPEHLNELLREIKLMLKDGEEVNVPSTLN